MRSQTERIIKDCSISYLLHLFCPVHPLRPPGSSQVPNVLTTEGREMTTACLQGAWKQRTWSTWYPNHLWFFTKSSSGGFKVTVPSRLSYLSGSSSLAFPTKTLFLCLSLKPESPWMGSSSHLISFSIRGLSPLQSAPPLWGPPLNFSRSNPQSRPECQIASQCSRWTT